MSLPVFLCRSPNDIIDVTLHLAEDLCRKRAYLHAMLLDRRQGSSSSALPDQSRHFLSLDYGITAMLAPDLVKQ